MDWSLSRLLLLGLAFLLIGCDFKQPSNGQAPVIEKNGETFEVSRSSPSPNGNQVRVASRTQVAGGTLHQTEWWIDRAILEKQPKWNGLTDELPLSAQKACASALPDIKARFPAVEEWRVQTVYLRNLAFGGTSGNTYSYPDVWIYEITFEPANETGRKLEDDVGVGALTQVVLMDGAIVPPIEIGNQSGTADGVPSER